MLPEKFAGRLFQAQNTLDPAELLAIKVVYFDVFGGDIVRDKDSALRDCGAGISASDRGSP